MAPKTYGDDDEEPEVSYHESSDEDFDPQTAPADDVASSDDDDAATNRRGKRRTRDESDALDSGDEVTIAAARKPKPKKRRKGDVTWDDDDADGGLIKTRAQRAVEQKEIKPLAQTHGATVDVDALWAQMTAAPLHPIPASTAQTPTIHTTPSQHPTAKPTSTPASPSPLLTVTKIYTFAGQTTVEEKHIPSSQLAQHTASGWILSTTPSGEPTTTTPATESTTATVQDTTPTVHRPPKRPSRFDPNPTGTVRLLPPTQQLTWPRSTASTALSHPLSATTNPLLSASTAAKPTKLNVVAKSRLDWGGFVDKAGIAEELQEHGKSKENYMGRREFLEGVERRREEEGRRGRIANVGVGGSG